MPNLTPTTDYKPTYPGGSIVDTGTGPTVTPGPSVADASLYSRIPSSPPPSPNNPNITGTNGTPDPTNTIRDTIKSLQSSVDYTNKIYDQKIAEFNSGTGNANAGKARVAANLAGLAGSTGADEVNAKATAATEKGRAQIEQERASRINALYGSLDVAEKNLDKTVNSQVESERADATLAGKTSAFSAIKSLATELKGVNFKQFTQADPNTYQQLLKLNGGDAAQLELSYNEALAKSSPKGSASDYKFVRASDGSQQAFEYNPTTGQLSRRTDLDITAPSAASDSATSKPWTPDGGKTWYAIPEDAKGHLTFPEDGNLSQYKMNVGGKTPSTPAPKASPTKDDISKVANFINDPNNKLKGADGYISPKDWQDALTEWTNAGYSTQSFITNFKAYANPNDVYAGLAGNKKASSGTSADINSLPN